MAGTGGDAQIVIATGSATRQYHAVRKADRTWAAFDDRKGYEGLPGQGHRQVLVDLADTRGECRVRSCRAALAGAEARQ
ncbi:hypothetical protein [Streptomyces sp. NPDC056480]|uniref:hypothetical protein n=1 Tax=Streptomyces sp. NPDC056480 TaxID=3345833 RepID=UPI0036C5DA2C